MLLRRGGMLSLLALAANLNISCSTAPIYLKGQHRENDETVIIDGLRRTEQTCFINIRKIEDQRKDTQGLGLLGGRPVFSEDFSRWVADGFKTLAHGGYVVSFDKDKEIAVSRVDLDIDIKIAHLRSISTSMNATLVLAVGYDNREGRIVPKKIYRGFETDINWASTESEIKALLNVALSKILKEISDDLKSFCQ